MADDKIGLGSLTPSLKAFLLVLTIIVLIVPCVLGFVNFDKRLDIAEGNQADIEEDVKLQKTEILQTVSMGLLGHSKLIEEVKLESKELEEAFDESAKDNEEEHDDFVAMIHQLGLTIRDFTGLVDSLKKGQGDMLYEVRINRTKIDALFNPDFEEE